MIKIQIPTNLDILNNIISKPEKKYFSEVLMVSNVNNKYLLDEWLNWHLNIIKFDHAVVILNNITYDYAEIAKKYNVDIIKQDGILSQSNIYNYYVNSSEAEWVLPIDSDEFLYFSNKYNNINELINKYKEYKKISFSWLYINDNELKQSRDLNKSVINTLNYYKIYNKDEYPFIKTMVNTKLLHRYYSDYDNEYIKNSKTYSLDELCCKQNTEFEKLNDIINTGTVHNPVTIDDNGNYIFAYDINSNSYNIGMYNNFILDDSADVYLMHFMYRSLDEWIDKINASRFYDIWKPVYDNKCTVEHIINYFKYNKFKYTDKPIYKYERY